MTRGVRSFVDNSSNDSLLVDVECNITNGLPSIIIIGHASKAVDEAKERLRASFTNSNLVLPKKRVVLNLSPADLPKDATSLDLAMAIAILDASEQISSGKLDDAVFFGELSLTGELMPIRGLVGRLISAKEKGFNTFYLPKANYEQAKLIPSITIKPANNLRDVYLDLSNSMSLKAFRTGLATKRPSLITRQYIDYSEIADQPIAKRALQIAAAGHHNILMYGPPGTGKTMLAKAMIGILPDLDYEEVLEVTQLHSLSTNEVSEIVWDRPFRAPHHTASVASIVGGGTNPRPGEASLAHRGVLFLDELPEFSQNTLEALRQPLEDGQVNISRAKGSASYPAEFILVATQNPCPCGYFGTSKPCGCSAAAIAKYEKKISGPILDRIDLHLPVNDIDHKKILTSQGRAKESPPIREAITRVYEIQKKRFGKTRFNSSLSNQEIREIGHLEPEAKLFLDNGAKKLGISARAYIRAIRVARTIADLDNKKSISPKHIAEALHYRRISSFS